MALAKLSSETGIPTVTRRMRRVILMPRWGVQRTAVQEYEVTLPRVRILDGPPPEDGAHE